MNSYNRTNRLNMSNIKMFLSFALFLLLVSKLSAQESQGNMFQYNPAEKTYPQPPETSSFEKFITIPPGNHTGVHGFSVPIYNLQAAEYIIPISIDYHGGGIKVDEISGEVGLGWSLNIGGINLSQEVRGLNDNFSYKAQITNPIEFNSSIDPTSENYLAAVDMAGVAELMTGQPANFNTDAGVEYNPDYYSYSLLNESGKFIFDKQGVAHTIPKKSTEILDNGKTLIDTKGVRYEFSQYQHTENFSPINGNGISPRSYSHAYRIDRIIFPTNDTIKFNYIQKNYSYISNFSVSRKVYAGGQYSSCIYPFSNENYHTVRTYANVHLVESIEYKDTRINFSYLEGREDVNGGVRLDRIKIYYAALSMDLKKEYKINSSYFISPNHSTAVPSTEDFPSSILFRRLRLDSIEELRSGQVYTFHYFDNYQLPARFSYSVDHWGGI